MRHLALPLAVLASAAAAGEWTDWRWQAPVETGGVPAGRLVAVWLTPQVYDAARPDLADLRLVDGAGAELPWTLRSAEAEGLSPDHATVAIAMVRVINQNEATRIELDLGHRNLPLRDLTLRFTEASFARRYSLSVRDGELSSDDGRWRHVRGGSLHDGLTIDLNGIKSRHLLVRIENGKESPLHYDGAVVSRSVELLAFRAPEGGGCTLYFGNPTAPMPPEDRELPAARLAREDVFPSALGEAVANAAAEPAIDRGQPGEATKLVRSAEWAERYKAILWVVMILVLCVLFLLVYRQAKSVKPPDGGPR